MIIRQFIGTAITVMIPVVLTCETVLSQSVFEDKQKETVIANNIESVTTWDFYYSGNKPDKNGIKTSFSRFDKKGNTVETITYKSRDILSHETFEYNTQGKRTDYIKKNGVKIAYQKTSSYDDRGNLLKEEGFDGSSAFRNEYIYENNDKVKEISYYAGNALKEKRIFKNTGNQTDITVYNGSNTVVSYLTLKYDDRGNVIEETVYSLDKVPLEKKLYVYNSDDHVISEVKYRGGAFYYKLTYLYNSKGDLTNIDEENPGESRFLKKLFTYDDAGNLLGMQWRRNSKEKFSTRSYLYDSGNNCTQYETFYPGTDFRVLTKLEYDSF